MPTTRGSNAAG